MEEKRKRALVILSIAIGMIIFSGGLLLITWIADNEPFFIATIIGIIFGLILGSGLIVYIKLAKKKRKKSNA